MRELLEIIYMKILNKELETDKEIDRFYFNFVKEFQTFTSLRDFEIYFNKIPIKSSGIEVEKLLHNEADCGILQNFIDNGIHNIDIFNDILSNVKTSTLYGILFLSLFNEKVQFIK